MSDASKRVNDREASDLETLDLDRLDPQVEAVASVDPAASPEVIHVPEDGRRLFLRRSLQIGLGLAAATLSMGSFQVCNNWAGQRGGGGGGGGGSSSCSCVSNCTCNPVCRCTSVCNGKSGCSCNLHRS